MPQSAPPTYDVAIAGAGIFGLSIAFAALQEGLSVAVIEAQRAGAGASGGLLGALMPHMPARWNAKKAFQFQALSGLADHIRTVERVSGLTCGYMRLGRILPLTTKDKLEHHLERAEESKLRWQPETTGFTYQVEPPGSRSDWLAPEAAPFGIVYETLAARVSPRDYVAALAAAVQTGGTLIEGSGLDSFNETSSTVHLTDGQSLSANTLVLANGFQAFDQIEQLTGEHIGRGEKGQALLMDGSGLENRPALYCDGLYVVPHDNGTVAIGSTSDRTFQDTDINPDRSAELVRRATAFCPSLAGRTVLTDWAGVRPRCNRRDPLIGRLPGLSQVFAAVGGFKISFGIAHLVADALVAEMTGRPPVVPLPETFRPDNHFGARRLDADIRSASS